MEIQRQCDPAATVPDDGDLIRWACAAVVTGSGSSEVTIRVVDKNEIQTANSQWREQDKPTNVLSFPAEFPPEAGIQYLGDVMICAQVLQAESVSQQKSLHAHWAHIVTHGMLHLQGFDHENEKDAREMEALEVEILASFGYNNPYEPGFPESDKS